MQTPTRESIVDQIANRLTNDPDNCTHITVPVPWLRVLCDLPEPVPAVEPGSDVSAEVTPDESTTEPEEVDTPPPAPKRRRRTNSTPENL